jgi:hemerythrin-like domain-containing protein
LFLLALHNSLEEEFVYNEMSTWPDLKPFVDRSFEEHHQVNNDIRQLNNSMERNPDPESFRGDMERLRNEFVRHMEKEEKQVLPKLRQTMPKELQLKIGKDFKHAKQERMNLPLEKLLPAQQTVPTREPQSVPIR